MPPSTFDGMELKVDIPFDQVLRLLEQLTPSQRKKAEAALEKSAQGRKTKTDDFDKFLLNGPVFSKEQLKRIAETRKAFARWRKK